MCRGASVRMKRRHGVVVIVAAAILAASIGASVRWRGRGARPSPPPPWRRARASWASPTTRCSRPPPAPPGASSAVASRPGWRCRAGRSPESRRSPGRTRSSCRPRTRALRRPRPTPSSSSRPRPRATSPGWIRWSSLVRSRRLPSNCNHTGYLTYAIADLWLDEHVADVNAKLATLKITQIGGTPKSCDRRPSTNRATTSCLRYSSVPTCSTTRRAATFPVG